MHQNKNKINQTIQKHFPVLAEQVLKYLQPREGESYLDLTAGYGGHASLVLERTLAPQAATLVDRDGVAIDYLQQHFHSGVQIVHNDFYTSAQTLLQAGRQYDCILADLGVSSPHLDNARRGFSFSLEGPLDMRMDMDQALTADIIVNDYDQAALAEILRNYGEEPKSAAIARAIVASRPIHTTSDLVTVVAKSWPGYSKHHPATRTFQALRIAVNDELQILHQALPVWAKLLAPQGRLVIISFHSLEDRIVKQFLTEHTGNRYDTDMQLLTKKPVTADNHELVLNPRSRSAKLRAAAKIKTKKKG